MIYFGTFPFKNGAIKQYWEEMKGIGVNSGSKLESYRRYPELIEMSPRGLV